MAHVSRLSDRVEPAIVAQAIQEGNPVMLSQSGTVNGFGTDLPLAVPASSGSMIVFALFAAPDNFPRPVDLRQYRAGWYTTLGRTDGSYSEPLETVTRYNTGLSNMADPVVPSGVLVNLHRGGTYRVGSSSYTSTDAIKVPGAMIKVDESNKWAYTPAKTECVGYVKQWYSDTLELDIELNQ